MSVDAPSAPDLAALQQKCIDVRMATLEEVEVSGSGHYGPAFSCVELFVALYYGWLRIRPSEPNWPVRDRFILSKGHACSSLYPVLADLGFFDTSVLATFTTLGTTLGDHPDMKKVPGVDFSSGSLGHGLSVGAGQAEALRLQGHDSRVVVLLGDGELNEGQNWEAVTYAAHRQLGNLLAIVDVNGVSVDGPTSGVMAMEPLEDKWRAFGWRVERIDGHDLTVIQAALNQFDDARGEGTAPPTVLLADTVAGRGVQFIEGMAEWHVGYLADVDRERAVADIRSMFQEIP